MAQKRKLQVFVSSTFTDLREERQAAVEAILTTGHIPAGMELFAGKNEEQMSIIKDWIDESDIFMLLLGGRYGSVEKKSGKSYIHLEYDYATSKEKPIFAIVASDDYIKQKVRENPDGAEGIMELEFRKEYTNFKNDITGKYVKHWNNKDQLQLYIIRTLNTLEKDETLVGWVPGSEIANSEIILLEINRLKHNSVLDAEELEKLKFENDTLKEEIRQLKEVGSQELKHPSSYDGLSNEEVFELLEREKLEIEEFREIYSISLINVSEMVNSSEKSPTLFDFFILWSAFDYPEIDTSDNQYYDSLLLKLKELGLVVELEGRTWGTQRSARTWVFSVGPEGRRFLVKRKVKIHSFNEKKINKIVNIIKENDNNSGFYPFL